MHEPVKIDKYELTGRCIQTVRIGVNYTVMGTNDQDTARRRTLEGILSAVDHCNELMRLVAQAESHDDAARAVMNLLALQEDQVASVMEMQVRLFTVAGRKRIVAELASLASESTI